MKVDANSIRYLKRLVDQGYELDAKGRLIHRVVCRQAHGPYPDNWVVYHVDLNVKNNKPENLIALPRDVHRILRQMLKGQQIQIDRKTLARAVASFRSSGNVKDVLSPAIALHEELTFNPSSSEWTSIRSGSSLYR